MKHSEDKGNLTFFSDGGQILIACDKGHYWMIDAKYGEISPAGDGAARIKLSPDLDRFGPAAIQALRQAPG